MAQIHPFHCGDAYKYATCLKRSNGGKREWEEKNMLDARCG